MIEYHSDPARIASSDLAGFFDGWPDPPSIETHLQLLRSSSHVVVAVESDTVRVVGFVTAITDGVLAAYLPLLEVLPDFQGAGIGSELITRLLEVIGDLYMIDVVCDADVQPFYARLGFMATNGMIRRHYANQSGR